MHSSRNAFRTLLSCAIVSSGTDVCSSWANAAAYTIAKISQVAGQAVPSINNHGDVAFVGSIPSFPSQTGVYRGSGTLLTTIDSGGPYLPVPATAIDNSGRVAFVELFPDFAPNLYSGNGGALTNISPFPGPFRNNISRHMAMSDDGSVAFLSSNDGTVAGTRGTGIFVGSGGPLRTVNTTTEYLFNSVPGPSMSDNGIIAYVWTGTGGASQSLRLDRAGVPSTLAVTADDPFAGFFSVAVNNFANVAFSGGFSFSDRGIYLRTETNLLQLAGTAGAFSGFGELSLNNHDEVAFIASLDATTGLGIYQGPDAILDRVIHAGDPLDGSFVNSVRLGQSALNDAGQIAFQAILADGRSGIYVATRIPEPKACLALALIAAAALVQRKRVSS